MPYFKWCGVNLQAAICKGASYARSKQELEALLLDRDIALINGHEVSRKWFRRRVKNSTVILAFKQLASLLEAGLTIPYALQTLYKQLPQSDFKDVIYMLGADVQDGLSLSTAMQNYGWLFSPMMIHMVRVGEHVGTMSAVFNALAFYMESQEEFQRKITQALMMPVITFIFFIAIALVVLVGVVPQFQDIFGSLGKTVPFSTQVLISLSVFLKSYGLTVLAGVVFVGWWVRRVLAKRHAIDLFLFLPFLHGLAYDIAIVQITQALALLLNSGVNLVAAMNIALYVLSANSLKSQFGATTKAVVAGYTLDAAIVQYMPSFAKEDLLALIRIGHESSQLSQALDSVANLYHAKIERTLQYITLLVQPVLMVILGLLITGMIIAIYMPLFSVAQIL